jgi:hypothetical protein
MREFTDVEEAEGAEDTGSARRHGETEATRRIL